MASNRMVISYFKIIKILLFLYFCGLNAHKRGYGFDAVYTRVSFIILMFVEILYISRHNSIRLKSAFKWYLLFVCYYFLSIMWTQATTDLFAQEIMMNFIQILGVTFVFNVHLHDEKDYQFVFKALLWSLIYMVILLVIRTPLSAWGSDRVGSVMALNSNDVGIRTAMGVLFCLYFSKQNRLYYFPAFILGVVSLLSGSRKGFIIMIIALSLYLLIKDQGWKKIINAILIVICCGAVIYAVFKVPAFYNVIGSRLERTFYTFLGKNLHNHYGMLLLDYSGIERAEFRKMAINYFLKYPVLGLGGNGFVTQMRLRSFHHVAFSHCNFTEILANFGVVGFVIFYYKQFSNLFKGFKWIIHRKQTTPLFLVLLVLNFVLIVIDYYYVSYYSVFSMIVVALIINYMEKIYKNNSLEVMEC